MKLFLIVLLVFYSAIGFAQKNITQSSYKANLNTDHWNLQNCMWSDAHRNLSPESKPLLDYDAIDNWVSFSDQPVSINRNGQYIAYSYGYDLPVTLKPMFDTLVLQSTKGDWRRIVTGAKSGFFSADNKQYIFKKKDGLYFIELGSDRNRVVKDVADYKTASNGENEWLAYKLTNKDLILHNLLTGREKTVGSIASYTFASQGSQLFYQLKNESKDLVVYNLNTESEFRFSFVDKYTFDANGTAMLLKIANPSINTGRSQLQYVDLTNEKAIPIWQANDNSTLSDFQLDGSGKQAVFVVQSGNPTKNSIWYWRQGMEKAVMKLNDQSRGIGASLVIHGNASFTDNNNYIQFYLSPQNQKQDAESDAAMMDVWNYKDAILQSTQINQKDRQVKYTCVLNPQSGGVIQLEKDNEQLNMFGSSIKGDNALIVKTPDNDRFWESEYDDRTFIVISLKDGSRRLLTERGWAKSPFSCNGKYLVYFARDHAGTYYSYNTQTGKIANISSGVAAGQFANKDPYLRLKDKKTPRSIFVLSLIIGWVGENSILVSDNYDIWQLDLEGQKNPVNLTNGYGKINHTVFQVSGSGDGFVYKANDTLLLKAFNRQNKFNGYYRKILGSKDNPEKLYMGPCFMENVTEMGGSGRSMKPIKAADVNIWIVQKQTPTDAPNYFLTKDFKEYRQLTNLQPQRNYNWYTTELHHFKQLDGTIGQGVLYKPENFDPTKKYPVIVSFYETGLSDQLYQFMPPEYISKPSIFQQPAWMVSHGYLVFIPDMYFIEGNWGQTTMNSIDGAARYLKTLPYVDSKSIGVGGHSNSGRYGYYLLTHSNSFAAMAIGSGHGGTDILSIALSDGDDLKWAERQASGEGLGSIWQNKEKWIDHIALLQSDKVSSPLLLFQNKKEGDNLSYPFIINGDAVLLGKQLFVALRRQNKPAWWLQYDEESHVVGKLKDMRDFTLRYSQYFDHYLKHAPAPKWMTEGIPAKLKTIEARYELDPSGTCDLPDKKECPVCAAWNKEYKRTPEMFTKSIAEWHLDKDIEQEMERKLMAKWAILDKEEKKQQQETVNIIKHGYPGDRKQ